MKIAFLATHFPDYSVEAATSLSSKCDLLFIADQFHINKDSNPEKFSTLLKSGKAIAFRTNPRYYLPFGTLKILWNIFLFRPDAVIAHEHPQPHIVFLHYVLSKITRILLIVHDPAPHSGNDSKYATRNMRWRNALRRIAHTYIVHGAYCASLLSQTTNVAGKNIVTVPHGPVMVPPDVALLPAKRRILMFGRMEAYKGLNVLLDAIKILKAKGFLLVLRLAGSGPELNRLEKDFTETGLCSIFSVFVGREQALQEFHDCDVVIAPYTEATQSGVIAAAYANGRPVIASNVGGIPDFVVDNVNGLLVRPNDPGELATAIETYFMTKGLPQKLADGAAHTINTSMSWSVFSEKILIAVRNAKG